MNFAKLSDGMCPRCSAPLERISLPDPKSIGVIAAAEGEGLRVRTVGTYALDRLGEIDYAYPLVPAGECRTCKEAWSMTSEGGARTVSYWTRQDEFVVSHVAMEVAE